MLSPTIRRRGFTLTEMLFVLVIFGLVAAATTRIIVGQQKFYASTTDLIAMQTTLRDISEALPSDLRAISSVGGDIYAMSDSAIDFRLSTGISIICSIGVGRLTAVIPPPTLASRSGITTWISAPTTGDTMFVYNPGATSATSDDSWQGPIPVTAALAVGICPTTTGYTSTTAEQNGSQTLTFATALNANVVVGNVIRFYRHAKYKLYQPAGSTSWYLGYQECPAGVCGAIQPVAGPYLAYSATPASTGLRFVYRDSTGAVTTTTTQVARIDIIAKAQTQNPIRMPGRPEDYYSDSLVVTVALRNRS